ncbi:MAG: DUF2851 family protein [Flavicella sp.]|nr:DUF2851 family protein [Flavicella sp.]
MKRMEPIASGVTINEEFLYYLWKFKLFDFQHIHTLDNQKIQILKVGTFNTNSGPDFLNGLLEIGQQKWAGNIEFHIKSSDWYVHGHETDKNYDAVVLHIVWEYDVPVFYSNQSEIPTLVLKNFVSPGILEKYYQLFSQQEKWILCEEEIGNTDPFIMTSWLNRLYFERLEKKYFDILELLDSNKNDWEAVLFVLISRSFGTKINADAFMNLAKSIDYKLIRKYRNETGMLEALLFGQAGFLEEHSEDVFYVHLKSEYEFLKRKHSLIPLNKEQFLFFRLRPNNFPSIRISQLAVLYEAHTHLFSELMKCKKLDDYYKILETETSLYWKNHYVFGKISIEKSKNISKSFMEVLLINVIIPLQYAFRKYNSQHNFDDLENFIHSIKKENNAVVNNFREVGVSVTSAMDTQALLQLKNEYCNYKRCLQCTIGLQLLK